MIRRFKRAPIVVVVCCVAIGLLGSSVLADTGSQLKDAKAQLKALEATISRSEATVASLQSQLVSTAASLTAARAKQATLYVQVTLTRADLTATRQQYTRIRSQLDARARAAYMAGPGSELQAVLSAKSLSDLSDTLEILNRVSQQDAALAAKTQRLADSLVLKKQHLQSLLDEQLALVRRLDAAQRDLTAQFVAQQSALADLSSARAEAKALVTKLAKRLAAEELAAARAAAGSGMTISYGTWAQNLLGRLGASSCHNNLVVVVAWEATEYTQASWNPLATTLSMPGATIFNSAGVRNYLSLGQGLDATMATLQKPGFGYDAIRSNLSACVDPMVTGQSINASSWCRGCAGGNYVLAIIPAVEAYYSSYANR